MNDLLSVVSVDVLALAYDPDSRHVLLGLHRRPVEPFAGAQHAVAVAVAPSQVASDGAQDLRVVIDAQDDGFTGHD